MVLLELVSLDIRVLFLRFLLDMLHWTYRKYSIKHLQVIKHGRHLQVSMPLAVSTPVLTMAMHIILHS